MTEEVWGEEVKEAEMVVVAVMMMMEAEEAEMVLVAVMMMMEAEEAEMVVAVVAVMMMMMEAEEAEEGSTAPRMYRCSQTLPARMIQTGS